jgi:hypothetical protein
MHAIARRNSAPASACRKGIVYSCSTHGDFDFRDRQNSHCRFSRFASTEEEDLTESGSIQSQLCLETAGHGPFSPTLTSLRIRARSALSCRSMTAFCFAPSWSTLKGPQPMMSYKTTTERTKKGVLE